MGLCKLLPMNSSENKQLEKGLLKKLSSIVAALLCLGIALTDKGIAADKIFERFVPLAGLEYVPGEIVVKFKGSLSEEEISALNSKHGVSTLYISPFAGFSRLSIPNGSTVTEMVETYSKDERVEYAEANYIAHALMIPNDELYAYQWHLYNTNYGGIQMEHAWDAATGSDVIVAVIDTGIAYENYYPDSISEDICYEKAPDLTGTYFLAGYDFVDDDDHPNDESTHGHGTQIAGVIAQSTNNSYGTASVAFNVSLLPLRVLDGSGAGTYANLADAIIWATDSSANVINLGLGGTEPSITLENAVAYAHDSGVTVVAAAGNDSRNSLRYPAAYDDYVIAVGATRYDEKSAYYSNWGMGLDLVAPGGDLTIDQNEDGYGDGILQQSYHKNGCDNVSWNYYFAEGTSMAAAQVSAIAALLMSAGVAATPAEVRQALESTAEDKGLAGWDRQYGWGLVDAEAALQWTSEVPSPHPAAMFTAEPQSGAEQLTVQFIDQSTGDISSWSWDFGDGQTSTEQNPIHTYIKASHYTVSLTVAGSGGTDTETKRKCINVFMPSSPSADFEAEPMDGVAPLTVDFTDQSKCSAIFVYREKGSFYVISGDASDLGGITDWAWDFGDGETSTERNPTHTYSLAGSYTVNLTVTGPGGTSTKNKENYIEVQVSSLPSAHVSVDVSKHRSWWLGHRVISTVRLKDAYINDLPIKNATVEGHWSGNYSENVTGTTDENGTAQFNKSLSRSQSSITFTVDRVTKDGQVFNLSGQLSDSR
jgi:serine protease